MHPTLQIVPLMSGLKPIASIQLLTECVAGCKCVSMALASLVVDRALQIAGCAQCNQHAQSLHNIKAKHLEHLVMLADLCIELLPLLINSTYVSEVLFPPHEDLLNLKRGQLDSLQPNKLSSSVEAKP